jgi:hypothetical protein
METPPDRIPEPARDPVEAEEDAAAAEAARIGGEAEYGDVDPAERALAEAGGGEAEGFEQAEADLIERAEHGEGGYDRGAPEPEAGRAGAAYGDADDLDRTDETAPLEGADGGEGEDPAGR